MTSTPLRVPAPAAPPRLTPAIRATFTVFACAGFVIATWAARIPQVRAHFQLTPSQLGLLLFCCAAGGAVALPASGPLVTRIGARRAVTRAAGLLAVGLAGTAGGYLAGVPLMAAGLFALGCAISCGDVAMNVHAAEVERRLGRAIMSRFHAGFSLGTVAGALAGALLVAAHVTVSVHLAAVAAVIAVVVPAAARHFLPGHSAPRAAGPRRGPPPRGLAPWRELRTLLVGLVALAFAFAEGSGNDWISISVIDHRGVTAPVGALTFASFLAAMTSARWFGTAWLDRWGRTAVLRATTVIAITGLIVFVFGPSLAATVAGAVLWGAGISLGFPVSMSAGGQDAALAAGRVSVISSIGYSAYLIGPPLVGFLSDQAGVTRALLAVAAVLIWPVLAAPAVGAPDRAGQASLPELWAGDVPRVSIN